MAKKDAQVFPRDEVERARWLTTAERVRILEREHEQDILDHFYEQIDPARIGSWGRPTRALNMLGSFASQLAVLYDDRPKVSNPDLTPEGEAALGDLDPFRLHKAHQKFVLGLRENLLHVRWSPGVPGSAPPGLDVRLVHPNRVVLTAPPSSPSVPVRVEEARERWDPIRGKWKWVWDCWSIEDPKAPYFKVEEEGANGRRKDVTAVYLRDSAPSAYPYVDPLTSHPYLPWTLAHAEPTCGLWDETAWDELVQGTYDSSLLATMYLHVCKNSSWSQGYGIDVEIPGMSTAGSGASASHRVPLDYSSMLLLRSKGDKASVGSLAQPSDPQAVIASIRSYTQMVVESMGMTGSDVEVSASAASGVAIQLRRDAVRRLQASYEAEARRSDLDFLRKCCLVTNLFSGPDVPPLPTEGWEITYTGLPFSREEEAERLAMWERRIALGLASRVDVLLSEHPEWTREQAIERLTEIRNENALTGGPTAGSV